MLGCLNGNGGKKLRRSKNSNLHLAGIFGKRSDFSKNYRPVDDGTLRHMLLLVILLEVTASASVPAPASASAPVSALASTQASASASKALVVFRHQPSVIRHQATVSFSSYQWQ